MNTLALFARQPVPGQVKTRLAASWGAARAADLYECFLRDQFERFDQTADRRIVAYSPGDASANGWFRTAAPRWQLWPQPQAGLGERLAACFAHWCSSPSDRMVLIGSDSPGLPCVEFDRAFSLLETHEVVLGPAADGGYWLVGLRGNLPRARRIFSDIDWSTPDVLRQTVQQIHSLNLTLGLVSLWFDVDTEAEVATLRGLLAADATVDLPRTRRFLANSV